MSAGSHFCARSCKRLVPSVLGARGHPGRDAYRGLPTNDVPRAPVLASRSRPSRACLSNARGCFIPNRADVAGELADIRVSSLLVASDDRGDGSPENAAARPTPGARVATVAGAPQAQGQKAAICPQGCESLPVHHWLADRSQAQPH